MKNILALLSVVLFPLNLPAAISVTGFDPICDSLQNRLNMLASHEKRIKLSKVLSRQGHLDFYFSRELGDYPLSQNDINWIRSFLIDNNPYGKYKIGGIYSNGIKIEQLLNVPKMKDPRPEYPFIEQVGEKRFAKGLDRRCIALWQSHGRYYNEADSCWLYQRAPLHRTVEDIFTQSFVIPFLIPMLENAGAYVITPRERDCNPYEVIADNDASFSKGRSLPQMRCLGTYHESGMWTECRTGFADSCAVYSGSENPFTAGTSKTAVCLGYEKASAEAIWELPFREAGNYSVYISYQSLPHSSKCAHYRVKHAGGESEFIVDQSISGGCWVYLGHFDFDKKGIVILDNSTPKGRTHKSGSVVSADAVRAGGGMGKIARGGEVSGLPAYLEGAMYNLQWSGFNKSVWGNEKRDYVNDYSCRPYWVKELKDRYGLRADAALAFHTDAGMTKRDTTIGTLAIYTLKSDGSRKLPDGTDRMTCRRFAMTVQDEVVNDIRRNWDPEWSRRGIRDRAYRESRATDVPTMLLELLSHQCLDDMKYGLDPQFRFDVSRSVYKGILKYLSELYECSYAVQPLPVKRFSLGWKSESELALSWASAIDPAEGSARPKGYILYTRIDSGSFDKGKYVKDCSTSVKISKGHIYSFKVVAWNDGGKSFPSEILSAGRPVQENGAPVLVVNGFTRVSAPTWFSGEDFAGFDLRKDGGVPWGDDLTYLGEVYEFRRNSLWISDHTPGFGASYADYRDGTVAGNTFDFTSAHGAALMALGRAFCSSSMEAFDGKGCGVVDLICGKQATTLPAKDSCARYAVFNPQLRNSISRLLSGGGKLIISGARIGSDESAGKFINEALGYRCVSSRAGRDGIVSIGACRMSYKTDPNPDIYCVENSDALRPVSEKGSIIARYSDKLPAGVYVSDKNTVAFGFPIEVLGEKYIRKVLEISLEKLK